MSPPSLIAASGAARTLRAMTLSPVVALLLLIASLVPPNAGAQSLLWSAHLHGEVPPWQIPSFGERSRGTLVATPLMPSWDPDSRSVMLLSDAGEPGIVLAGSAQVGDSIQTEPPGTPWLSKIARSDGRLLWDWHPADYAEGYLSEAVIDAAGDIAAIGTHYTPDYDVGFFVVKIDAATGALRWRVDGPIGDTFGTGIALDAAGNVVVSAVDTLRTHVIAKYDRDTGAPIWSSGVSEPDAWNDALVVVDAADNVVAAGGYEVNNNGEVVEDGLQVSKFRGTDGALLWRQRFVSDFGATVYALRTLGEGDVVVAGWFGGGVSLARLASATGAVVWERGDVDPEDMLVDGEGRIVVAGGIPLPDSSLRIEDIQRIDAASGSTLWRQQLYARTFSSAWRVALGVDGQLLAGLTVEQGDDVFGAAGIDLATGALRWWYAPPGVGADDDRFPVGILQAPDGAIVYGGLNYVPADDEATWTVYELAPIAADTVFLGCFD